MVIIAGAHHVQIRAVRDREDLMFDDDWDQSVKDLSKMHICIRIVLLHVFGLFLRCMWTMYFLICDCDRVDSCSLPLRTLSKNSLCMMILPLS